VAAIGMEGFSFRTAIHEATPARGSRSWLEFIRTAKTPELPVVLLEDSGALLGLVFAASGLGLATATGESRYDAVGSMAIGLLLGAIAVILAIESKSLLIGESATPDADRRIRAAINAAPEVRRTIHVRTLQLGPEEILLATKLDLVAADVAALAVAIDRVEVQIREAVPTVGLIYIEPDLYRSGSDPA
jgi:divalent metal cation (Fe/Co/Zn/Cd) transporter